MTTIRFPSSTRAWTALALAAALTSASALAVGKPKLSDIERRYQQERAVCLNGTSNQDRATCLREAGAARTEAQRGGLGNGPAPDASSKRCDEMRDKDRDECIARIKGDHTTTSGSVAAGGILRERVTRETGVPPSPVKADSDAREAPAR